MRILIPYHHWSNKIQSNKDDQYDSIKDKPEIKKIKEMFDAQIDKDQIKQFKE